MSGGKYALFQRSTVGPLPLPWPPGGPSLVIWLRLLEATMPFSMVLALPQASLVIWLTPLEATMPFSIVAAMPQAPEVAPQAPEFGPFEFCIWKQLCPFPEVYCLPPAHPPAPRWPWFGYLAEGDYAKCLGPLCQRDPIVMGKFQYFSDARMWTQCTPQKLDIVWAVSSLYLNNLAS